MSNNTTNNSIFLLGLVPPCLRNYWPEQVAYWRKGGRSPTYMLLKDPADLDDLSKYDFNLAIWRDNGTLTYVSPNSARQDSPCLGERYLSLHFEDHGLNVLYIVGRTKEVMKETAAYFMSKKRYGTKNCTSGSNELSNKSMDTSVVLLGMIPPYLLKPEQVPHWSLGGRSPTYMLLNNTFDLDELNSYDDNLAIWCNNGTLTYVSPKRARRDFPRLGEIILSLHFEDQGLHLYIVGETNEAMKETADFFKTKSGGIMLSESTDNSLLLLGMIPPYLRTPDQVPHWQKGGSSPTYMLMKSTFDLFELFKYKENLAIWCDNGTLTYVLPNQSYRTYSFWEYYGRSNRDSQNSPLLDISCHFRYFADRGLHMFIVGETEEGIKETADFFEYKSATMFSESTDTSLFLLGMIPPYLRRPEQVPHWRKGGHSPTYMLLKDPADLDELNKYNYNLAIWRDNGTLTYLSPNTAHQDSPRLGERFLYLKAEDHGLHLYIVGETDEAMAGTAAFFLNLEGKKLESSSSLEACTFNFTFDFQAGPGCLRHIFEANNKKQLTALADSRCHMRLHFHACHFDDKGRALLDVIQDKRSTFDVLLSKGCTGLTSHNLKRLVHVNTMKRLTLPCLSKNIALLPFSAQVEYLDYSISSSVLEKVIGSVDIATTRISLTIHHDSGTFPTACMISLFRRLADLKHLLELRIRLNFVLIRTHRTIPDCVVQELLLATLANEKLERLDLGDSTRHFDWAPHINALFEGVQSHKNLCSFIIDVYNDHELFASNCSSLRQLLTANRRIRVTNGNGLLCCCGVMFNSDIKELYSFNGFYCGSADLTMDPPSDRLSLVTTALSKSASFNFQRSAVLLANHVDVLYELLPSAIAYHVPIHEHVFP